MKRLKYLFLLCLTVGTGTAIAQDRNLNGVTVESNYTPPEINYTASTDIGNPKWSRLRAYVNTLTTASIANNITLTIDTASVFTTNATVYGAYVSGGISNGTTADIVIDAQVLGLSGAYGIQSSNTLYGNLKGNIRITGAANSYGISTSSGIATSYLTLSLYGNIEAIGINNAYAIARTGIGGSATGLSVSLHGNATLSATKTNGTLGYAIYSENTANNAILNADTGNVYSIIGNLHSGKGFNINSGAYKITSDTWSAGGNGFYTLASGANVILTKSMQIRSGAESTSALSLKTGSSLTLSIFGKNDNMSIDLGMKSLELESGSILNLETNYVINAGDSFNIFTNVTDVIGTTLDNLTVKLNGVDIITLTDYEFKQSDNNIIFSRINTSIPEPSEMASLIGIMGLCFMLARREKRTY